MTPEQIEQMTAENARPALRGAAALENKLRELITEQSEGEWDDATIEKDVQNFAAAIRALITPTEGPKP